jgi:hypothetical protein
MASPPTVILDYEPPPARLAVRLARRVAALARAVWRRRPWPAELLLLGWSTLCIAHVILEVSRSRYPRAYISALRQEDWVALLLGMTIGGAWGLARQRRWRTLVTCVGVMLVLGIASGVIQLTSCPHATYIQMLWFHVPIIGDPCNNGQPFRAPWWM